jgi:hypothetical protein
MLAITGRHDMTFDFSSISAAQMIGLFVIFLVLLIVFVVIRFFWQHVVKYLLHGCVVILAIIAILVLLHYFGVF